MALPVSAAVATPETATTASASASSETPEPEARFEAAAFKEAARTGQRVEIIDRREEKAEFFANPDGTTTRRSYGTAKWTRWQGMWAKTDPTLVRNDDGTITPAGAAFSITFSGGGTQPMATMVKRGRKLALTWPAALPDPVIEGETAVYRSVLPDVDLKLTAEVDGFAQHLIVKNAQAAANPALRSIKLGIQTDGVALTETADNKLLAKDDTGETIFSAPGPKMWEQPPVAPEEQASTARKAAARTASAAVPEGELPDSAPVAADVTGSTLTLTPDADLLAAADQFPLVIDPVFGEGDREKWAVVYSATPGASYPNGSGWNSSNPADEPRVGYNGTGATRSFFAMNTNGLEGAEILDAKFDVITTHTWGCDAAAAGPTELWSTGSLTDNITWTNNGSLWAAKLDSASYAGNNATYCPGVNPSNDYQSTALTNYVRQAAQNHWGTLAFGLRAASGYEYNPDSYKRFRNNPVLEVEYNYKPTVDARSVYEGTWSPSGDGNKQVACGGVIGNSGIALTAKVSDQDRGSVTAHFEVKDSSGTTVPFFGGIPVLASTVSSGQTADAVMPAIRLKTGTYTWTVYATDGEGPASATTTPCAFTVDRVGPDKAVTVLDTDGTPVNQETDKYPARKPVQLRFTNSVPDVVGYCWAMDHFVSVSSTRCANGTWVDAGTDADNTATVTVTPTGYPSSTLYVLAYDAAGNHSPFDGTVDKVKLSTTPAEFVYEPGITPLTPGTYAHDRRGDTNGDGYADFVATDTDGKLRLYKGNGTMNPPAAAVTIGTSGWGGALIAHRGDLQGFTSPTAMPDGYEDFLVRLSNGGLYLYPGNGLGSPWVYARQEIIHPVEPDWGGVRQLVMPGNIDGKPGNDLITIECVWNGDAIAQCINGKLLLYSGNATAGGGQPFSAVPTEIGSGGWRDFTNLAMDDLNGDGVADLVARDPAEGKLYRYLGKMSPDNCTNNCTLSFPIADRTVYGSGGWNTRPYLSSPGNIQGTVTSTSVEEDGQEILFKQFQPTPGEEYGDFWATTPADPDLTVGYVDSTGTSRTTTCPTGCLLTYPGGPTLHRQPYLSGTGAWATTITGIF
ncbi:hypothetical protein [Streptomyces sp. NPDC048350]|uniref:hypothetical protein n=1 Tax=Streptomyces sp. NPDC048350 TaxID=3365538 RepID=UPI00371B1F22